MTTEDSEVKVGSIVNRPWGYYTIVAQEKDYAVKLLYINPGEETSLQRHSRRHELITLLDGSVEITHGATTFRKDRGSRTASYRIKAGEWHRFAVPSEQKDPAVILEIAHGELDPDDFERGDDKYNRVRTRGPGFVDRIMDDYDWRKR
jgi:mannose-6-phosphate isomerase-like protein (cupin superfamily)